MPDDSRRMTQPNRQRRKGDLIAQSALLANGRFKLRFPLAQLALQLHQIVDRAGMLQKVAQPRDAGAHRFNPRIEVGPRCRDVVGLDRAVRFVAKIGEAAHERVEVFGRHPHDQFCDSPVAVSGAALICDHAMNFRCLVRYRFGRFVDIGYFDADIATANQSALLQRAGRFGGRGLGCTGHRLGPRDVLAHATGCAAVESGRHADRRRRFRRMLRTTRGDQAGCDHQCD